MNHLQTAVKKTKSADLTVEEKGAVIEFWDILNDEFRSKFADIKPEDKKPEGGEGGEGEDEGIDEKTLKSFISKSAQKVIDEKAEAIAESLVKSIGGKIDAQRAKFAADGVSTKSQENDAITRKFLHALRNNNVEVLKELNPKNKAINSTNDGSGADAGYLIPQVLANEVLRIVPAGYGIARQEFGYNLIADGNSKRITALGSVLSVFWTGEGNAKGASQPTFKLVTLLLKKLTVIVPMTEEIVDDAGVDLTALVAQLIREAVDKETDLQYFNGDGTVWLGILNDTSIPATTLLATKYAAAIRPEDIIALETGTALSVNGKYYMHRTVLAAIRTLRQNADGTGNYLYNPIGMNAETYGTLNNRPVVLVEAMPTFTQANAANKPIMIYGDLSKGVAYGEKGDVQFKLLDQATIHDVNGTTAINLAEQDMLALRAVKRTGMKVVLPAAMRRLVSGPAS